MCSKKSDYKTKTNNTTVTLGGIQLNLFYSHLVAANLISGGMHREMSKWKPQFPLENWGIYPITPRWKQHQLKIEEAKK